MAEERAFENGRISIFQGLMTLTLNQVILHTIVHHSSTSTYIPNFTEIKETFCGWTDVCTYVHMYVCMDRHLRPALLGRLCRRVNVKKCECMFYIQCWKRLLLASDYSGREETNRQCSACHASNLQHSQDQHQTLPSSSSPSHQTQRSETDPTHTHTHRAIHNRPYTHTYAGTWRGSLQSISCPNPSTRYPPGLAIHQDSPSIRTRHPSGLRWVQDRSFVRLLLRAEVSALTLDRWRVSSETSLSGNKQQLHSSDSCFSRPSALYISSVVTVILSTNLTHSNHKIHHNMLNIFLLN